MLLHGVVHAGPIDDVFEARNRAAAEAAAGDHAGAAETLRALVADNPFDGSLWLDLGRAERRAGDQAAAVAALERALEIGTGNVPGRGFRENVYFEIALAQVELDDLGAGDSLAAALAARHRNPAAMLGHPALATVVRDARFATHSPSSDANDRIEGWRNDFARLYREVERMSVSAEGVGPRPGFLEDLRVLERAIPDIDDGTIFVRLMRLMASLGNGHSSIFPTPGAPFALSVLPIELYAFDEGFFVVGGHAETERWIGAQIVGIGGRDVDAVARDIEAFIPSDNPIGRRAFLAYGLTIVSVLRDVGVANGNEVELTLVDVDGETHRVLVRGEDFRPPPAPPSAGAELSRQNPDLAYWFEPIREAVYVQYNAIVERHDLPLARFLEQLRRHVDEAGVRNLILDLRRNGGGDSFLNRDVVRALVHFEMDRPGRRIFVLISRHTYSAAQNLATDIERMTDAIFVGEPTGSRPNHVGEDSFYLLAYSKLAVSVASRYFQTSEPTDDRIWIAPHVAVPVTAEGFFAGRDVALEQIIESL